MKKYLLKHQVRMYVLYSYMELLYCTYVILGERIAPLVSNPGRIMLTSSRMYFQPYNNVELVS